jgi:hypothetical protein
MIRFAACFVSVALLALGGLACESSSGSDDGPDVVGVDPLYDPTLGPYGSGGYSEQRPGGGSVTVIIQVPEETGPTQP